MGGKVRLTITDVYEGRDYPNFGISEVALGLEGLMPAPILRIQAMKPTTM